MIEERLRCPMCGGATHPATGCEYTPTFVVCWRCTKDFWRWALVHINGKGRRKGLSFYEHVKGPEPKVDENSLGPTIAIDRKESS